MLHVTWRGCQEVAPDVTGFWTETFPLAETSFKTHLLSWRVKEHLKKLKEILILFFKGSKPKHHAIRVTNGA